MRQDFIPGGSPWKPDFSPSLKRMQPGLLIGHFSACPLAGRGDGRVFRGDRPSLPGSVTLVRREQASGVQHHPTLRRGCSGSSGGLGRAAAKTLAGSAQSLLCGFGHGLDFWFADEIRHDLRIEEADDDPARRFFANDHIAWQQQADVCHRGDGLVASGGLQAPRMR